MYTSEGADFGPSPSVARFTLGIFSHDDPNEVTDHKLIQAMRKRLMDEIASGDKKAASHTQKIINNVYGGGSAPTSSGGIMDKMAHQGGQESPDDDNYFVDIMRQNYAPGSEAEMTDPDTGEKIKKKLENGGWSKSVHRFKSKKKVT